MKPYILNYSQTVKIQPSMLRYDSYGKVNYPEGRGLLDSTVITENIESDDRDEIFSCSTIETRSLEPADDDQMFFDSTMITKTFEPADDDEIGLSSTLVTHTVEPSDPDE